MLLPMFVMETIQAKVGGAVSFSFIIIRLNGSKTSADRISSGGGAGVFKLFISVEAIGPLKAIKALNLPIKDIARAIESRNLEF
ncbi:MAG: hypothetical protein R2875_09165 [Desulfobacterales bacterium]